MIDIIMRRLFPPVEEPEPEPEEEEEEEPEPEPEPEPDFDTTNLEKLRKKATPLDLCFILDITGSM